MPEPRREPGRNFLDSEAFKPGFVEADLTSALDLRPVVTLNGTPVEQARSVDALLAEGAEPVLWGMGRSPRAVTELKSNGGMIEVMASATGHRVLADALPAEARAPDSKPWEPIEMLAMVDATGLSAPLLVTTSSRVEEVDSHYRNYLTRRYRIGERLPPGFYRIVVGP